MRRLALLLLLSGQASSLNLNNQPIESRQAGARLSTQRQYAIDCRTNMTCATDGGVLYLSASGGSGAGGAPVDGGFVTFSGGTTGSSNERTLTAGTNIAISVATPGQVGIAVTGTVASATTATQLASDPAACSAGQYVSDISAAGALTCSTPPGTYTLPDSTSSVTGGVRLTGDLGGTATSPAVVDDSHAHTGTTISALDVADITSGTLSQARGGMGAASLTCSAGQFVTCNGTACSCSTPSGGGGGSGPNVGQFTVTFGDGTVATGDSATATVTAAWVTSTSSIVLTPACWVYDGGAGPTPDECATSLPECTVTAVVASASFAVKCRSEVGGFGTYFINYSGI